MLWVFVILLAASVALFFLARRTRQSAGLPAGRVIYTDTRGWGAVEKPLYDPEWNLTGKPDYLVEQGASIIPVEVKSTRIGAAPYDAHIYQLAAYCRLVQVQFGKRPTHGILHYPNRTFAIDYTPELEAALEALVQEIHASERRKELPRSHEQAARCARCGFRSVCDQRLM
jgi:CRISPR-associated exonuclease Cas4